MNGACRSTPTRSPIRSADDFVLTLWTEDPALARRADAAGVDRVGVDLERLGKADRQRGLGTWISPHREETLAAVGAALENAEVFARVNPVNAGTEREVEAVLALGARVLMLPMVLTGDQARTFVRVVGGRATVILLVEHAAALGRLPELVGVEGVDEVHLGLNDLSLSLGLSSRWLVLADDLALDAGAIVRRAGLRFGFGGVGRVGDNDLPIAADLIYAEYARTGATAALLSRSFFAAGGGDNLETEVGRVRAALADWQARSAADVAAAHAELAERARRTATW